MSNKDIRILLNTPSKEEGEEQLDELLPLAVGFAARYLGKKALQAGAGKLVKGGLKAGVGAGKLGMFGAGKLVKGGLKAGVGAGKLGMVGAGKLVKGGLKAGVGAGKLGMVGAEKLVKGGLKAGGKVVGGGLKAGGKVVGGAYNAATAAPVIAAKAVRKGVEAGASGDVRKLGTRVGLGRRGEIRRRKAEAESIAQSVADKLERAQKKSGSQNDSGSKNFNQILSRFERFNK